MQYIKFRGTLRPAARHAANDAEKLIAIISPSSLPKQIKNNNYNTKFTKCFDYFSKKFLMMKYYFILITYKARYLLISA